MAWPTGTNRPHVSPSTRRRILKRDDYTCQHCGAIDTPLEVDHIDNTRGFGYDEDNNMQALCVACHKRKTQQEAATARATRRARRKLPTGQHPGLNY